MDDSQFLSLVRELTSLTRKTEWVELKHNSVMDGKPLVLFEVQPAPNRPVLFKGVAYIRIGSYKKKLQAHPEKERELWRVFERTPFEKGLAMESATPDDVLSLIDYPNYFRMMKRPLPENREAILERLTSEKVIVPKGRDRHAITNVGAVLFARNLNDFDRLARKAHGECDTT